MEKAIASIAERGRGRGKQGKSIQALLRNRVFCPKCGKPMVIRRDSHTHRVYYCCRHCWRVVDNPCSFWKFVPGTWDNLVWEDICSLLRDDTWVEQQITSVQSQDENTAKLIRLEQFKISQARTKTAKIREGFEGGVYSMDEAKRRIADHQATIAKAEVEIQRLRQSVNVSSRSKADIDAIRGELTALRDKNLDEATFEEKLDIISMLGLKVYPSEDLKSMRVTCQVNLERVQTKGKSSTIIPSEIKADGECELAAKCGKVNIA